MYTFVFDCYNIIILGQNKAKYVLYKILGSLLRGQKGNNLRLLCPVYVVTVTPTEGFFLSQFVKI